MSKNSYQNLLARLAKRGPDAEGAEQWAQVAATRPEHELQAAAATAAPVETEPPLDDVPLPRGDATLDALCSRISNLVGDKGVVKPAPAPVRTVAQPMAPPKASAPAAKTVPPPSDNEWMPTEPADFAKAGLTDSQVEALVLKLLLNRGNATGRQISEHVRLPFKLIDELLRSMKADQLVVYRNSAMMNDYEYAITDMGRERGRRLFDECTYFGAAPVSLKDYLESVKAQTIANQHPTQADLERAFEDLLINKRMLNRLGPAVNSGRGLFLYGAPGNGKTSIAERITAAFGQVIWIPRALGIDGEIVRLFDPLSHEELPLKANDHLWDSRHIDRRWVRIRRPTIVVGGELTMDNLEISFNRSTGISEAPLQLKSNCGTLVIDDFGRQRMRVDELLNRWIVPLEKRYDFLNLANGKKIQVPFDQLIVFSTNLEPKNLVDDAFLRRIPYKIDVQDPSETEYRELFSLMAEKLGFNANPGALDYLISQHYLRINRPFRCCQPRDLLLQVRNYCKYLGREPQLTEEYLDYAVENYFAVM